MAQETQTLRESVPDNEQSLDGTASNGLPPEDSGVRPAVGTRPLDRLCRFVPALGALRHYTATLFRRDFLAGLTVAAVAVPQAMAYATIAGLPPQYGLYTAIVMTAAGALLDPTGKLINGPTNAISIALFSALAVVEGSVEQRIQYAVLLALLMGLIQVGITLLRLGDLTRYISHAVIVGFTIGAGTLLVLSQLDNLLGLPASQEGGDHFLLRVWQSLCRLDRINVPTAAIGLGTVAIVLALTWINYRYRLPIPELLTAVMLMAFVVWFGGLDGNGVKVVGQIDAELPSFQAPDLKWSRIRGLAASALAIALLGLLEAIAMAKAIALQARQKLDVNQQCLSEGVANIAGSFFQCIPGSGSLTRSAINVQAGAATQWAGIFSAIAVALTVLLLARFAYYIPYSALAGILMVAAYRLVDWPQLRYFLRTTRFDAGIVIATALAAVIISVEFCILIGVFLSFILYVPRAARVHLTQFTVTKDRVLRERLPSDAPCNRILIFSLEGELFFGSAPDLEEHLETIEAKATSGVRFVVLRLKRVRNTDAVCLRIFENFLREMEQRNVKVLMCGVRRDLAKVFRTSGLGQRLGIHAMYRETAGASSTLDALRQAYEWLGDDLCPNCPRRHEPAREVLYYMI
ncbi:MAG: SulP family inorganic anion transporter [Planctomycetes bacterium]|nr:SulP family inorganic anion transporter [Planctomycetota bacterium]